MIVNMYIDNIKFYVGVVVWYIFGMKRWLTEAVILWAEISIE